MIQKKNIEIPRYAVPEYLMKPLLSNLDDTTPGHRFLLYFQGASYKTYLEGEKRDVNNRSREIGRKLESGEWGRIYKQYWPDEWVPLKDTKLYALKSVGAKSETARTLTEALRSRQALLAQRLSREVVSVSLNLTAPLATGLGNPHPVENGFSFLSPYGVPYLPGSGIKGAVRRAAEELALFDESSNWTIPLVWLLFGFEGSSAYISSFSKLEAIDIVKEEAERWRNAFLQYAEKEADKDEVLKYWLSLEAIRKALPEKFKDIWKEPGEFCKSMQKNEKLRNSISWQGLVRFWDAFIDTDSLEVDILNPHHKDYYEGKGSPHDAESPKPVLFLTVPAGAKFTIYCQLSKKIKSLPIDDCHSLVREAVEYACEWVGFGAKTAVGYGVGSPLDRDKKGEREQKPEGSRESKREAQKNDSEEVLKEFRVQVDQSKNLPGEINTFIQRVQFQESADLRKKMCLALLEKAQSLKKDKKFSKALKNNKSWAVQLKKLLEENEIEL